MRPLILAISLLALGTSCGPTCKSTCERLYGDTPDCAIERPGRTRTDLLDFCMTECTTATGIPGDVGDYDPYERLSSAEAATLENRAQAEVWMDCVAETSCDRFSEGYCAPVW
ncbi:MAG: hypothetical protein H6739_18185 [Alphaproteobacteria bacterium]|nr:hypothetical protein [Alphaproteobacteria bacterium]